MQRSFNVLVLVWLLASCGARQHAESDGAPDDAGGCGAPAAEAPGLVRTRHGLVRAVADGQTWSYRGIPFAAAPVGELRWKPPVAPACDEEERASEFPPPCLQPDRDGGVTGQEDCLYLNVWSPDTASPGELPVMVFIHGGGNISGSTTEAAGGVLLYDGKELAERGDVVVVTLQYRLNIFGHMVHELLDAESASGTSGNYALQDQIAALEWVQDNIAAFGGDPGRVLVFGESGGGADVCGLYASPAAAGLFTSAIMQSGGCGGKSRDDLAAMGEELITTAGCATDADPLACLRAREGDAILPLVDTSSVDPNGRIATRFGPTVDGMILPDSPDRMIARGEHNHVPFVIGANADETTHAVFGIPRDLTAAGYRLRVHAIFGLVLGDAVLAHYPVETFPSPFRAMVAITTDLQFLCPARTWARSAASAQDEPVYRYLYSHVLQGPAAFVGAMHGMELVFVFQKVARFPDYDESAGDLALEAEVLDRWTRFAATGDPGSDGAPTWPRYDPASDRYLDLSDPSTAGDGIHTAACDFWDSLQ